MSDTPSFDIQAAHRYFSAYCFNRAWELIEKTDRGAQEDEEMLRLSLAATWHWTQRPDCTPTNLSIGYWQTARIYTLLNQVENARRYAKLCLETSQIEGVPPFYLAYAYEALARTEMIAGQPSSMQEYLAQALQLATKVEDEEDRGYLEKDLDTIK
jgi:hypothetical protein